MSIPHTDDGHMEALRFRAATWVALAAGLVVAACVSAFPTINCVALADTYWIALEWFGFTIIFVAIATGVQYHRGPKWRRVIGIIALFLSIATASTTAACSLFNLGIAKEHCLVAAKEPPRDHIFLARPWQVWVWLNFLRS